MKEAAKEAGLSATEIARRMQISAATIYRWWEGERSPSSEKVEKYAAVVGKDAAWMYRQVDEDQLIRDFSEWVLKFADAIRAGKLADVAFDEVVGNSEELSLRERRMLRESDAALRSYLSNLPEDREERLALLERIASTLKT